MNNSINCAGFIEMFRDSNDDFEPYGCSEVSELPENCSPLTQGKKTGFHNDIVPEPDK